MFNRKFNKYLEFATTKLNILLKEQTVNRDKHTVKYILDKAPGSNQLIIIFSGMPREGFKARYNYLRTLNSVKANKLFILDDLGFDERGGYYLGKNEDFFFEKYVLDLIREVKTKLSIDTTIYCGSSKGVWAAMYFGVREQGSIIISGSFQYKLGNYITRNDVVEKNLMQYVMGSQYTDDDVTYLNDLLYQTLVKYKENDNKIYLHYSINESTYKLHMKHFIKDLDKLDINYELNVADYNKHSDLSLYLPVFLQKTICNII